MSKGMTGPVTASSEKVERWAVHELALPGPAGGNPFADVELRVSYRYRNRVVTVDGFYDGDVDGTRCVLRYLGDRQPASVELDLPGDAQYRVELIDTFAMTVEELRGRFSGRCTIPLPQRPYLALRGVR